MTARDGSDSEPITGPSKAGPDFPIERDELRPLSPALVIARQFLNLFRYPIRWIHEYIVEPNRGPKYYWYHRKYERALPVDECYIDDHVCMYEASLQFMRDYSVDRATLDLLRYRRDSCLFWNSTTRDSMLIDEKCLPLKETYDREEVNFHVKYGNMRYQPTALECYNKQKHRMIVERRKALREKAARKEDVES